MSLRPCGTLGDGRLLMQDDLTGAVVVSQAEPKFIVDDAVQRPQRPTNPETERLARSALMKAEQGLPISDEERRAFLEDNRDQRNWLDSHPAPTGTTGIPYHKL